MTKKLKYILPILIGVIVLFLYAFKSKESIYFHKIRYTASSVELVEWNTKDTLNTSFVKEIVDKSGRTKELRFYNYKHELYWAGSGFWGGPIIRYNYEENKIIETFFSSDNEIANDFRTSEVPYRHIYFLNEQNQIVEIKQIYKMDFEWTKESLEQSIKHLVFYEQYPDDDSEESYDLNNVFGYNYAYAKMNGIDPKQKK